MTGAKMPTNESIMREASNLRMLERGQTPLLGEMNPTLELTNTSESNQGQSGEYLQLSV
jgi:hypothetical protein